MAGNGYFDKNENKYLPKSIETWADYDASSTGNDWDAFTAWSGTPVLPLTFTTGIIDYGSVETLNYLVGVDANFPAYITVRYGDTVDSALGLIDNVSTVSVSPSQTLEAVKARYFQFVISVDRDSASEDLPYIAGITNTLTNELIERTLTSISSTGLSGIIGIRQLSAFEGISYVTSIVTQPHHQDAQYVQSEDSAGALYVESDDSATDYYVESPQQIPIILVNKGTSPITLNIYDANNSNAPVDCVFDAVAQGLPELSSDANGNITQAT